MLPENHFPMPLKRRSWRPEFSGRGKIRPRQTTNILVWFPPKNP